MSNQSETEDNNEHGNKRKKAIFFLRMCHKSFDNYDCQLDNYIKQLKNL